MPIDPVTGMLIASAVSTGGGLLGGLLGGSDDRSAQREANQLNRSRYRAALGQAREAQQIAQGTAAELRDPNGAVMQNIARAQGDIQEVGVQARRDILDRGRQSLAQQDASLRRRGLYNTTTTEAARRGVMLDTERNMARLNERIAGLRSNAASNAASQYSSNILAASGQEQSAIDRFIDIIASRQDVATPSGGAAFGAQAGAQAGQLIGNLLALAGGGGGGGTQELAGPPRPGTYNLPGG